ncbi:MAG: Hint domain-containing protein, partial [Acetobacteraceae bacterium]
EYLDQLNAQAEWGELDFWPASAARNAGQGIVADDQSQVRGAAWSLREIDEAAYANPDGSAMKAYFTQLENANFQYLVSQIPTWTAQEGQAYGYLPSVYYGSNLPPWEQDYFASTVVQAAEMGNQDAVQVLQWESNFLVGRFLNAANGFDPNDGIAYNLVTLDPSIDAPYTTWAEIEQATQAAGLSNGSGWTQSNGDYGQLALQSLAGIITVLGDPQAIKAYGWLLGSGAPYISEADFQNDPTYNIVPRLSDGNSLSWSNIIISNDSTATTIQGSPTADQLIDETGSGDVTVIGGSGINLLFAGSGNDLLIGGSNDDYIYAGSGSDTIYGGAGTNYLDAGTGSTTFLLDTQDQAQDTIADFQIGTDTIAVTDASGQLFPTGAIQATLASAAQDTSGQSFSPADIQAVIASATQNASGDAVLQISGSDAVTLDGISISSLTPEMFGQADTVPCFLSGTRIATERDQIPVERLKIGDLVHARFAGPTPIKWIGHRRIDCRRHPRPELVWPVRVRAQAFGPDQPVRELFLSPGHSVSVPAADGESDVLIPINHLINGLTVVQQPAASVRYFHVELPRHDILLAEGLPAESYLDTGNRAQFANPDAETALHADFAVHTWDDACAPLTTDGAAVLAMRQRLLARAAELGWTRSAEPQFDIVAGGKVIRPETISGKLYRWVLPAGTRKVRILSSTAVPAGLDLAASDFRTLGASIGAVSVDEEYIDLDNPALIAGFYPIERKGAECWRWTDGRAVLTVPWAERSLVLELLVRDVMAGWQERQPPLARAA